jgi:hypothetical protein
MRVRSSSNNTKNQVYQTWNEGLGAAGAISGSILAIPSDSEQINQNGRNVNSSIGNLVQSSLDVS